MAVALKYDIYDSLVKEFGSEKAKILNDFISEVSNDIQEKTNKSKTELKYEVRDDLLKELATKQEVLQVRTELQNVRTELKAEIDLAQTELKAEIIHVRTELKTDNIKLNQKFNFMIILLIIALTLMNPVVAKIIQNLLKI